MTRLNWCRRVAVRHGGRIRDLMKWAWLIVCWGVGAAVHSVQERSAEQWLRQVEQWSRVASDEGSSEAAEELAFLWLDLSDLLEPEEPISSRERRTLAQAFIQATATLASAQLETPLPAALEDEGYTRLEMWQAASAAASMIEATGPRAAVELSLCYALRDAGELDETRQRLQRATQEYPSTQLAPAFQIELAQLALYDGIYEEALRFLEEAESLLREGLPDHERRRTSLLGMRGKALLELGLPDQAKAFLEEERRRAENSGDRGLQLASLLNWSDLQAAQKDYGRLVSDLSSRLQTSQFDSVPAIRGELLVRLARGQRELERRDQQREPGAEQTLREALSIEVLKPMVRLSAQSLLVEVLLQRQAWALAGESLQQAEALLQELGRNNRERVSADAAARLVALRSAWLRSGGSGDAASALQSLREAFQGLVGKWKEAPRRPGGLGFLSYEPKRRQVLSEIILLGEQQEGEPGLRAGFEFLLVAQSLGTLAQRWDAPVGSVSHVQQSLVTGEQGLLVYFPARQQSHLFLVDAETFEHVSLPGSMALEEARIDALSLLIRSPGSVPDEERTTFFQRRESALRKLRTLLLPDVVGDRLSSWQAFSVVGLDLLGDVSFESLPDLEQPDKTLGERFALGYLPSIPLGLHLAEQSALAPADALELRLVAAPRTHPEVLDRFPEANRLEWSDSDREQWTRYYDQQRIEWATGPTATREWIETPRRSSQVLHLFLHGVYTDQRERPAGLVFSGNNGLVWGEDVERWRVSPLVILTACGAARGPLRQGDAGVAHLGGAFFAAGAQAVVLSSARVERHAALQFMKTFHERVRRSGDSPAMALREARRTMADSNGRADRFYHSLFQVHGLAHRPIFASASTRILAQNRGWWVVLAGVLVAMAGWVGFRTVRTPPTSSRSTGESA